MANSGDEFQSALKDFKNLSSAFYAPAIVLGSIELGIFDAISRGAETPDAVAAAVKADRRAVKVLLSNLVSYGYLTREGSAFRLTPFSAKALVSSSPLYEGDSARMSFWVHRLSGALVDVARSGRPAQLYEDAVNKDPEMAAVLVRAMDQISRAFLPELVKQVPMNGVSRMLDVGGASGSYAMALIEKEPNATAVVLELPNSAKEAERLISARGFGGRISVKQGDLCKDDFGREEYDLIFFSNIFHLLDRGMAAKVTLKCARALRQGGRLVIKDMIGNEQGELPGAASYQILMLLISRDGALHDEASYSGWCEEAGLSPVQRISCWERSSLLISRKE
jgi:cyclopropane fatty-acyl-phospholipid synthase-like methyltransferase